MSSPHAAIFVRDPAPMLAQARKMLAEQRDLWVFGYASLIWRPEFDADEQRPAVVMGWHRALEMRSRVNRGTPEQPGLVFALVHGGSCRGMAYRVEHRRAEAELERLWAREMPTGVYDPKWLACRTPGGIVRALAFTLSRRSPSHTGRIPDDQMVEVLRSSVGRFGSTYNYLMETAHSLRRCGIRDRDVERLVTLAQRHRIECPLACGRRAGAGNPVLHAGVAVPTSASRATTA